MIHQANDRDADLESAIKSEFSAMNAAPDKAIAREHWQNAVRLIGQRSAAKVEQMEFERGLR